MLSFLAVTLASSAVRGHLIAITGTSICGSPGERVPYPTDKDHSVVALKWVVLPVVFHTAAIEESPDLYLNPSPRLQGRARHPSERITSLTTTTRVFRSGIMRP